jgi:WD40 repeat protein
MYGNLMKLILELIMQRDLYMFTGLNKKMSKLAFKVLFENNLSRNIMITMGETIKIYNMKTKKCDMLLELNETIKSMSYLKQNLIATSNNKIIKIWDVISKNCLVTLNSKVFIKYLCYLYQDLMASGGEELIEIWNIKSKSLLKSITIPRMKFLCYLKNNLIATACCENIHIWNIESMEKIIMNLSDKIHISCLCYLKNDLLAFAKMTKFI